MIVNSPVSQILMCALFNTSTITPEGHISRYGISWEVLYRGLWYLFDTILIPNCFHKYCISFYSSKSVSDAFSPTVLTLGLSMLLILANSIGEKKSHLIIIIGNVLGLLMDVRHMLVIIFWSQPSKMSLVEVVHVIICNWKIYNKLIENTDVM